MQILAELGLLRKILRAIELHLIHHEERFGKELLTVSNQTTDDQRFVQVFAPADADNIPDGATAAVTVAVQDAAGNDLSKWIDVQADPANPARFTYTRKPSDGTQPAQLDFVAVATATLGTEQATLSTGFSFTPGAPTALTAVTSTEPLAAAAAPVEGGSAAEGATVA